jgi:hypothetical protein
MAAVPEFPRRIVELPAVATASAQTTVQAPAPAAAFDIHRQFIVHLSASIRLSFVFDTGGRIR